MRKLTINEIKASELQSLLLLRDFCKENGLKYYLTFGTLLGAVRHKGFIPWDDDIDIFLPRRDYKFLLENFNDWKRAKEQKREVLAKELVPQFYLNFAKIIDKNTRVTENGQTMEIGVWVDLFPLDELTITPFFNVKLDLCAKLLSFHEISLRKGRIWYKNLLVKGFHKIFPTDEPIRKYCQKILEHAKSQNGNYYALLYRDFERDYVPIIPKSMFEPSLELLFEGTAFSVPKEYDEFLKACYGDYTILPPIEDQKSHHKYTCCWKEEL